MLTDMSAIITYHLKNNGNINSTYLYIYIYIYLFVYIMAIGPAKMLCEGTEMMVSLGYRQFIGFAKNFHSLMAKRDVQPHFEYL